MFQTVGHDVVSLYGECMDIPLFRRPISGGSVVQDMDYDPQAGDEVEDLFELLAEVKVRRLLSEDKAGLSAMGHQSLTCLVIAASHARNSSCFGRRHSFQLPTNSC